jgi:flagellar protein FlaG
MSLSIRSMALAGSLTAGHVVVPAHAMPESPPAVAVPAVASPVKAPGAKEAEPAALAKAIDAANRKLADDGHEIHFEYDHDANKLIVRLVDTNTKEVLRQFPSNEALRIARLVNSGKPILDALA